MSIIVKQLSYTQPDGSILFRDINFTILKNQKASLIGNNGSGKSTLLRIISREIGASSGEIECEDIYYVPQHFGQYDSMSVAEALRIDKKLIALHKILKGDASDENFIYLEDDWNIENRLSDSFSFWGINHINPLQSMNTLSGGEKTKVFLAGINIHNPSTILMDEPTNHLDNDSRKGFYNFISQSRCTMLIVSHDRSLLNLLPQTFELSQNSIKTYGGNYDFYKAEKQDKERALENKLQEKEKALRAAKKTARETAERKQKLDARNEKSAGKKGLPRIILKTLKNKAEKSSSKLSDIHSDKIESISSELRQVRQSLPDRNELKLDFDNASLHIGKIIATAQNINFGYNRDKYLWQTSLNFEIRSGDRIIINGKNGSGKTTLLKLIFGELEPTQGLIKRSDISYVYVDQQYSLIDNCLTILELIKKHNKRNLPEHDLRAILNRFLFPSEACDKLCVNLSGGEKMRLVFCCLMTENNMPGLFVLDEPTNNLDITSLEVITSAIKNYIGTLIVISHDSFFANEIGIETSINL